MAKSVLAKRRIEDERTLVIVYNIAQVIPATVVGFTHAHGVVSEVDIAIIAWKYRDCQLQNSPSSERKEVRRFGGEDGAFVQKTANN
jgi:hypothetical protein